MVFNNEKNTNKYFNMVMAEMSSLFQVSKMLQNEEFGQAIMNTLLDEDGPRTVSRNPEPKELFVANKLFRGFAEIYTSVRCLENIEIYIRRFPFSKTRVTKLDYLKYNIENYLNEIYVLKERMISYSKTISRAYKKSSNAAAIAEHLKNASKLASDSLKNIVEIRGAHVHSIRYSDKDIDRLSNLELMLNSDNQDFREAFEKLYFVAYSEIRKKWAPLYHDIQNKNPSNQKKLLRYTMNFKQKISQIRKIWLRYTMKFNTKKSLKSEKNGSAIP